MNSYEQRMLIADSAEQLKHARRYLIGIKSELQIQTCTIEEIE